MNLSRRHFFGLFGAATAGVLPAAGPLTALAPFAQYRGDGLTDIRWRVTVPSDVWVETTQDPAAPRDTWTRVKPARDGLVFRWVTEACVTLHGTDPAKPLLFEAFALPKGAKDAVCVGKGRLRPITAPDGAVTLAFLNDIHGNTALIPKLLDTAAVRQALPGAVVFNGDCLDDCNSREGAEKRFLHALSEVTARGYHMIYLRGNHEYRGRMAYRIRECVSPLAGDAYYGVMQLGDLRMACIDSGEGKPDGHSFLGGRVLSDGYVADQALWLRQEFARDVWKQSPRRIAVSHIPLRCTNAREQNYYRPGFLRKHFDAVLNGAGLDALVAAHTHIYGFVPAGTDGCTYPNIVGGGPSEKSATVILLAASKKAFALSAYRPNGKELMKRSF